MGSCEKHGGFDARDELAIFFVEVSTNDCMMSTSAHLIARIVGPGPILKLCKPDEENLDFGVA